MSRKSEKIRELNDTLRIRGVGGRFMITSGVNALPPIVREEALKRMRAFTDFDKDNDPHGEHDFGSFHYGGDTFSFKVDYYDLNIQYGSEDPSDPSSTTRVLTLMLAEEY